MKNCQERPALCIKLLSGVSKPGVLGTLPPPHFFIKYCVLLLLLPTLVTGHFESRFDAHGYCQCDIGENCLLLSSIKSQ